MTNKPELLPCPFCASVPFSKECYWVEHQGWQVGCAKCEPAPMVAISSEQDDCIKAKPEAEKHWNTRAKPTVSLEGLVFVAARASNLKLQHESQHNYWLVGIKAILTNLQTLGVQFDVKD